ncbi:MAG: galactose oxidase [Pseudonocardiales bacterium]|nr:galactose oxidase [Pseudonocardiales bacterium]
MRKTRSIGMSSLLAAVLVTTSWGLSDHSPSSTGSPSIHELHGTHAMPMQAVPAAATVASASALSRTGWTATASDQETTSESAPASNVLDGNSATYWHSKWSSPATPLPHWITIDMHAVNTVSGLTYLPRVSTSPNGRIGQFTVTLSSDGSTWGSAVATGTWADDSTLKTASFTQQSARYVKLTALTEAGGRGPWSAAAEINLLGASSTTPAASYVVVSRTGWTATASDQETVSENGAASNVLDSNTSTIWHSQYSGTTPKPLPHWITIDMKASIPIDGLRYLPRPAGGNGTIGGYQVSVSSDGVTFGTALASGTWADDASEKTAAFAATSTTRYVRLTATSEAGARGPWSTAAEINLIQKTSSAPALGSWGPVINFPIVPVSAALLPGNKLLTFSAYSPTTFTTNATTTTDANSYTQTAILDLTTGVVSQRKISSTGQQMFCSGLAILPDGRILVNGGSDSGATSIYSPSTDTWAKGPTMNIPRGYEGDTTLSTGQVFTLGGSWNGGVGGRNGEIFNPNGTWALLKNVQATSILTTNDPQGVYREDNHGWFFATGGGGVFHAGPSKQLNWFTTTGDGSTQSAGNRSDSGDAMNGNAVMYDVNKILTLGGAPAYQNSTATNRAHTIDISKGPSQPVTVARTGDLAYARAFNNSVVLPDGTVLAIGGQPVPVPFTDTNAVLTPELWNPATGTFSSLAPMAKPRTYHSVAVLLPDGTVFSGGGGLCGTCTTNHADGQIFTPPYLLNADGTARTRPTLSGTPSSAANGATITVTATAGLTKFALVRMGATTHTVNSDQRRIPLAVSATSGTSYSLQLPADSGVAVPGPYLLFALDSKGTPSISQQITIG